MSEEKETKKIVVNQDLCIGCGGCVNEAPEYFEINDEGKSIVIKDYDESDKEVVDKAIKGCPVAVISLE